MLNEQTRRELKRFLVVGFSTVIVDFLSYRTLLYVATPIAGAKAVGFLIGTLFAYFANRAWTFSGATAPTGSAWRFIFIYGVNLGVNVTVNGGVLHLLNNGFGALTIAFIIATSISATLNFLGMKFFVFKTSMQEHTAQ